LLDTKKAARTAPPLQPVPYRMTVPTVHAANAPDFDRVPACQAIPATPALTMTASGSDGEVSGPPPPPGAGQECVRAAWRGR
jgi:hypothetical protein